MVILQLSKSSKDYLSLERKMRKALFIMLIIISISSFVFSVILERTVNPDPERRIILEDTFLAMLIGSIGVISSKRFSDVTTENLQQELRRIESKFEQQFKSIESKTEQN